MSNGGAAGTTGTETVFIDAYETRRIVLAEGIQGHGLIIDYLEQKLGDSITITNERKNAEYVNDDQQVRYQLNVVNKKNEFRDALETEGVIVVYLGHARYGRGSCFDSADRESGECWENGTSEENGIFRLGFPYIPVETDDFDHHSYSFAPIAAEEELPARERSHPYSYHPDARNKRINKIELPAAYRGQVLQGYDSDTDTYYGFRSRGKTNFLLHAGWQDTQSDPFDLGTVDLKCKTFCHFGCSSKIHFWEIFRRAEYKGWERPDPPIDRFAYFTTSTSDDRGGSYWVYYLLTYPNPASEPEHWFKSHQWAKQKANNKLSTEGVGYRIW